MIKAIVDQTGASIDVEDDGTVSIASPDQQSVQKAIEIIKSLTMTPEVGQTYKGKVVRLEEYGAFVELAPGKDGLLHISELDWQRVPHIEDRLKLGDEIEVKVIEAEREGRIRLSHRELLPKPEGYEPQPPRQPRGGGERRGGFSGRGGRGREGGNRERGSRGPRERSRH
jgi:polyribonucleotide nucleotidyltransferase